MKGSNRAGSLLLTMLGCMFSGSVFSTTMPAPVWHKIELANGDQIEVKLRGNEAFHWHEDRAGNALILKDDSWYFAEITLENGHSQLSSTGVRKTSEEHELEVSQYRPEAVSVHPLARANLFANKTAQFSPSQVDVSSAPSMRREASFASNAVNQPLLVVTVSFKDVVMRNDFQPLIFGNDGKQSVTDYFLKNSMNNYRVVPAVESQGQVNDGVISVSLELDHPDCHRGSYCNLKLNQVFKDAYSVVDNHLDFSAYDTNSDGTISPTELSVMFVFAGNDMSYGSLSGDPAIWPHKYSHDAISVDGKQISSYCLFADFQGDHQSTMGVIAHELGHLMLDLPDLYSYEHDGSIGSWGLMGGGSWGTKPGDRYPGETPVNMTAWSKHQANFLTPREITPSDDYVEIGNHEAAIVHLDPYLREYGSKLYLENRTYSGYDEALTAEGLLMTSVNVNNAFNYKGPMQVQVLQADNRKDLEIGRRSDSGDVFPGLYGITEIADNTAPSLQSITGQPSNVHISGINANASKASFFVEQPEPGNRFGLLTTFERSYVDPNQRPNMAAFALELPNDARLDGVQFHVSPTSIFTEHSYKVWRLPYSAPVFGNLSIDTSYADLIHQGQTEDGGRILFDTPWVLSAGKHLLVVEVESTAMFEANYLFSQPVVAENRRVERVWLGDESQASTTGLTMRNYYTTPFAALFDPDVSAGVFASDDSLTVQQDGSVSLNLRKNDFHKLGQSYSLEIVEAPQHGKIEGEQYVPNTGFVGMDSFSYRLVEEGSGLQSNVANVTVEISPSNHAPAVSIVPDYNAFKPGYGVTLVANATDADGDSLSYQWAIDSKVSVRQSLDSKSIWFVIPDSVVADDILEFSVEVTDARGAATAQALSMTVENSEPVARDDFATQELGTTVYYDVRANDEDHDGDRFHISAADFSGFVVLSDDLVEIEDGQIKFTAPNVMPESKELSITYQITAPWQGHVDSATLYISLTGESEQIPDTAPENGDSGSSGGGGGGPSIWLLLLSAFYSARIMQGRKLGI
ncbi:M6 family metalloprotease domain-containing protein [Grimontia kaedaensis]|uniref:M6 family metalloprotease domain-containing protein n=1 Tax=Grimontia kaedaensis TaxID=2872157 RepID=A0ABY4X1Y3_9GAMM|nr:M6 family metalloprotease domain-containing protein [Grimontia kaedaensis]USH05254.1 M6 family metalloprotease domain-containing protein [Grimontia kaedaensis]